MNLFNCFQAVGFYSLLPILIQWLFTNGYTTTSYIAGGIMFCGYIMLSSAVNEALK